jgi:hypothetical protein
MSARRLGLLLVGLVILGACWRGKAQEAAGDALLSKCKADLAERLKVPADEVKVVTVEGVTWPDASLGCPKPGMDYTMALVPGYRIVLEAAGAQYEYHTDQGRRFVHCENPTAAVGPGEGRPLQPPTPSDTPIGPEPPKPVVLALEAIANEPNGNSKLVARHLPPDERPPQTILDRCTDFAVAEDGSVLAKRRTSRSTHELVLIRAGEEPTVVMKGFDFEALTFVPPSTSYFLLAKENAGAPFRMYGGEANRGPVALEWAPEVRRADGAAVHFVQGIVVVSVPAAGEGAGRDVLVLDIYKGEVLAQFQSAKALPALSVE